MNKKIGGLVLATVIPAFFHLVEAQQPKKIPRIGWLTGVSLSGSVSVCQLRDFFQTPDVIRNSGFHRRRNSQALMNAAKVVVHEVERN